MGGAVSLRVRGSVGSVCCMSAVARGHRRPLCPCRYDVQCSRRDGGGGERERVTVRGEGGGRWGVEKGRGRRKFDRFAHRGRLSELPGFGDSFVTLLTSHTEVPCSIVVTSSSSAIDSRAGQIFSPVDATKPAVLYRSYHRQKKRRRRRREEKKEE